ncbi:hypothetical protein IB277_14770 [Ensifer sp. ENS07]|uniref:hypothetical protein n=1 Tax=unclassified Ensifer TaxID=2633371 RepID=UPI00177B6858|nr:MULTISPECIES: hypothetical protein [unclassified Ensifer]MBD9507936.1 hypothetical protein [Ensifer sp. ENS10]MBD9637567.1 hypothetical protein [Ensifer sp. ENS07]
MVAGEFRDDDGLTHDEWLARKQAQKAAQQPKPKPAAPRLDQNHILRAVGLAIGEAERELLEKIDQLRDGMKLDARREFRRALAEERAVADARQAAMRKEIDALKDEIAALKKGKTK